MLLDEINISFVLAFVSLKQGSALIRLIGEEWLD